MTKALDFVIRVVGVVLRIMLACTVIFVSCQILFRYIFNSPLSWTEQLSRFFFIWMMCLSVPVLFYKKDFMAFDLIQNKIPEPARSIIVILVKIAIVAFAVFWFYGSVTLIAGTLNKMTSGVKMHIYWLYSAQSVASALVVWVMSTQVVHDIRDFVRGKNSKEGSEE